MVSTAVALTALALAVAPFSAGSGVDAVTHPPSALDYCAPSIGCVD